MNVLLRPLPRSSVGTKYVMAVTGLLLIGFVLAHMAGNLLIFAGKDALNGYAHALEERPGLVWAARVILLAIFVLHIVLGIRLTRDNMRARPVRYVCEGTIQANWASRHMLLTGLVILAFVIYHLLHFTLGVTDPTHFKRSLHLYQPADLAQRPEYDVAAMVVAGFQQPVVTLVYVVAMFFLALHLFHGASSWFQSLGLNGRGYDKVINWVGPVLALIVLIGNCSIPLAILAGYVPK